MAGRLADDVAHAVLDMLFGAGANALAPASYFVGLSTTQPTNTGGNITEPSDAAYARVEVVNNATNFPAAANRQKLNGTEIQFPTATASWGSPGFFVLMDAATAGAMKARGDLASAQEIPSGTPPKFAVGALVISHPGT